MLRLSQYFCDRIFGFQCYFHETTLNPLLRESSCRLNGKRLNASLLARLAQKHVMTAWVMCPQWCHASSPGCRTPLIYSEYVFRNHTCSMITVVTTHTFADRCTKSLCCFLQDTNRFANEQRLAITYIQSQRSNHTESRIRSPGNQASLLYVVMAKVLMYKHYLGRIPLRKHLRLLYMLHSSNAAKLL